MSKYAGTGSGLSASKRRFRLFAGFATIALGVSLPAIAGAQEKDCPPGSWFCGETKAQATGDAKAENKELQQLPPDTSESTAKPSTQAAPPVVVVQPTQPVVVEPRPAPPPYYYVPRTPPKKSEWGINMHFGGLMMGNGRNGDTGMGLLGLGLRYRPVPGFALEGDIDVAGGTDYNGRDRTEVGYSLNGLVFLNPKSKVQLYLLGGIGFSAAHAWDKSPNVPYGDRAPRYDYSYFGVQGGAGVEFRVSKVVGLNLDLRGIYRGRIDSHRDEYPEFISSDGRTTNTSAAGVTTFGLTLYW